MARAIQLGATERQLFLISRRIEMIARIPETSSPFAISAPVLIELDAGFLPAATFEMPVAMVTDWQKYLACMAKRSFLIFAQV